MLVKVRGDHRRTLLLATSALMALAASNAQAGALPTGGAVTSGTAGIASTSTQVTITQSSAKAIVTWSDFSVGQGNTVQFNNGTGSTLNRVTGSNASQIDGALNATGSVYLINQNGVVIGKTGVVNVGGSFVASTLDLPDASYLAGGSLIFSGSSTASVLNLGQIGASGGDVALIAQTVENDGTITAASGDVGLLAGSQVTLSDTLSSNGKFQVTLGSGSSATNTGTIAAAIAELRAYGGNVYALAGNTGGSITATGISTNDGQIFLTASAPNGATGVGDITISGGVTFSGGANALTIDAFHNASILTPISTTGGHVTLTTNDGGVGGDYGFGVGYSGLSGSLSFLGGAGSGETLTINGHAYTLLYTLSLPGSTGPDAGTDDIAGIDNNGAAGGEGGRYALANDLTQPSGQVFSGPLIASDFDLFSGTFEGLGHTINNLTINDPTNGGHDGLLGSIGGSGTVRDLGLAGGVVTRASASSGGWYVGGLAGVNNGLVANVWTSETVTGITDDKIGGLIGISDHGAVIDAFATGSVSGGTISLVGGLVGEESSFGGSHPSSTIDSYATGSVSGGAGAYVGGLVGYVDTGDEVSAAYATGAVSGGAGASVGGLVGHNQGSVTAGYYDAATSGQALGAQIDGSIGLSGAQMLHAANFVGFDFSATGPWRIVEGSSFPYLAWQFVSTPEVVSGSVYSGLGGSPLSGLTVAGYENGTSLGSTTSGANGYYQLLLVQSAAANSDVATYLVGAPKDATALATGVDGQVAGLNLYEGALFVQTSAPAVLSLAPHYANALGGFTSSDLIWTPGTSLAAGLASGSSLVIKASGNFQLDEGLDLGAGTLEVDAAGTVSEFPHVILQVAELTGSSVGGASFTTSDNQISAFSWINTGAGGLTLDDFAAVTLNTVAAGTGDLTVGGPQSWRIYDVGMLSAGGTISLSAQAGIDVASQITAGGAVTLTGSSVGGVAEDGSGAISAASLGGSANMAVLNGANAVGAITGFSTNGGFLFNDTQVLTVRGPIDGGLGLLHLTSGGGLTIDGSLTSTGNMLLRANGDIAVDAGVNTASGLALYANSAVSETGTITANLLLGYSGGSTDLSGSNTINTLAGYQVYHGGATLTLADTAHLTVTAPVAAYAVSFTDPAGLSITGSGSVTAYGGGRTLNGAPF